MLQVHTSGSAAAEDDAIRSRDSKLLEYQDTIAHLEGTLAEAGGTVSDTSKRHSASIASMQRRIDEAHQKADRLAADLVEAHERLADAASLRNEDRLELAQMQHALTESQGVCQRMQLERDRSQGSKENAKEALEQCQKDAMSMKQQLEAQAFAAEERLCEAEANLKDLQDTHQAAMQKLTRKLQEAEAAALSRDQACEHLEHDLAAIQQELAEAVQQLQEAQASTSAQAEQMQQLHQDLDAADQEADNRSVQLSQLHKHLEAAKEVNKDLRAQVQRTADEAQSAMSDAGVFMQLFHWNMIL